MCVVSTVEGLEFLDTKLVAVGTLVCTWSIKLMKTYMKLIIRNIKGLTIQITWDTKIIMCVLFAWMIIITS